MLKRKVSTLWALMPNAEVDMCNNCFISIISRCCGFWSPLEDFVCVMNVSSRNSITVLLLATRIKNRPVVKGGFPL